MSSSQQIKKEEAATELDPNVEQRRASWPQACSWVAASAGTGKTKVLSDRVLRLLLPRENGSPGADPHKIVCLTFTKAAAGEMSLRINKRLSSWAVMSDEKLENDLEKNLLGRPASERECTEARKLFARVLDAPGSLKIMTVHAFCQSILKRFPLESGVSAHFELAEDVKAKKFLSDALNNVIRKAETETGSEIHGAFERLSAITDKDRLVTLFEDLCKERRQLHKISKNFWDAQGIHAALCNITGISHNASCKSIIEEACREENFDREDLRSVCVALASGSSTDKKKFEKIDLWLAGDEQGRIDDYFEYASAFIKKDGTIFAKHATQKVTKNYPDAKEIMDREAQRLKIAGQDLLKVNFAARTRDLFSLGLEISEEYSRIKDVHAALDYDDLILRTLELLEKDKDGPASWVMYKLDQGIDHILVDEAQDTNPEQWQVISQLCDEFFSGRGAREETLRTSFIVGDIKQSIYGFNRAAPDEFSRMHKDLRSRAETAEIEWRDIPLNISFRSTRTVLSLVDKVFSEPAMKKAAGGEYLEHKSFRSGQAGMTELWPLFENDPKEEPDLWSPVSPEQAGHSGQSKLAGYIATQIRKWLDDEENLPARGRSIRPGDILILMRSRNALVGHLMRELKSRNIPVAGLDRMVLSQQIAVQDIIGLVEFCLLPEDDLNLAEILKSPLIGVTEDELFRLSYGRDSTLWQNVKSSASKDVKEYLEWIIRENSKERPYEFLMRILQSPCPADPSGSGMRAMKKRLGEEITDPVEELLESALKYETASMPSLQGFLQEQLTGTTEIKREQEEAGTQVRIMTIHAAKGLQAPVVILPDTITINGANKTKRLLWPDKTGAKVPMWSVNSDSDPDFYRNYFEEIKSKEQEEAARLLYVALTRAEDRLYVAGATGSKKASENSWYFSVEKAFKKLDATELPDGVLRITGAQSKEPDRKDKTGIKTSDIASDKDIPEWIFRKAPPEPSPPKPLIPSRPSMEEPAAASPFAESKKDDYRFLRGNVTHRLLQFLPETDPDKREEAARNFTRKYSGELPESVCDEIAQETFAIINNPQFAKIFDSGSMAEVPVSGLLPGGKIVSGQIDRLAIDGDEVLIIDYKTNRNPPGPGENIPLAYKNQMEAYRSVLEKVYPDKTISCFLLWTDGPVITEVKNT